MDTLLTQTKTDIINDILNRVSDKILEKNSADLLIKLINTAETPKEAFLIAELGTTYKRTGLHFAKKLEKMGQSIKYLKRNPELSFINDPARLTHKLIIGDNYDTLQNLLISQRGNVDVIYIDPPYGKDSMGAFAATNYDNALSRDNLLSMLYPRLLLAKQLLSDKGVIFCSIDDRNHAYVKCLFDEVFGEINFVENFIWEKNATKNNSNTTSTNHEYVLCYAKDKAHVENLGLFRVVKPGYEDVKKILDEADKEEKTPEETEALLKAYYKQHPEYKGIIQYDKVDYGPTSSGQEHLQIFCIADLSAPKSTGSGPRYEVIHPITGKACKIPSRGWLFKKESMEYAIKDNRVYFYENETHVPRFKRYLDDVDTEVQKSIIRNYNDGKKELASIFNECPFDNPKTFTLIKHLISLVSRPDSTILDFFAGSGTTAQAVLELNREDGGHRRFILCNNNEITDTTPNGIALDVTSKRLKRIMSGLCYDGSNNFKWIKDNDPFMDNLDVFDIRSVLNSDQTPTGNPFAVIDETCYDLMPFSDIKDKIAWICMNFAPTQKYIDKKGK